MMIRRSGISLSLIIFLGACGSSPSDRLAVEVDNSSAITVDSTIVNSTTTSELVTTTSDVADSTVSPVIAPITTPDPPTTPTTSAPAPVTTPITAPAAPVITAPAAPVIVDPVGLRIEAEYDSGYDRDLFADWYDADRNGCNTRKEVLIAESLDPVIIGSSCSINGGRWFSIYDNVETTDASSFDIDHMVPLSEAWDSGAWNWNADQRKTFSNDLSQPYFLIAVTASSNRSKSDRDPAQWMPPNASYHCQYVRIWIDIKRAWDLSADQAEYDFLARTLARC